MQCGKCVNPQCLLYKKVYCSAAPENVARCPECDTPMQPVAANEVGSTIDLREARKAIQKHINSISDEQFEAELKDAGLGEEPEFNPWERVLVNPPPKVICTLRMVDPQKIEKMEADVAALRTENAALRAWQARAVAMLERLQFEENEDYCTICERYKFLTGHASDCALAALINEAK